MTPFDNIYDLALVVIQDYKIDNLATTDIESFKLYMRGFLINSIPEFSTTCFTSLEYDETQNCFIEDLSMLEKSILADIIVIKWMERETNNATQINLRLQGRDKKSNAESSNLKEKSERLDRLREKLAQKMVDYQLQPSYFDKVLNY